MIHYHESSLTPARDIVEPGLEVSHVTHHLEGVIQLETVEIDGRKTAIDPTMLVTLPWSEFVARPDAIDRYSVIADELEMRVIAIDNPGISGKSKLPHSLARDIRRGNFDGVSSLQWEVLHKVDAGIGQRALTMFAYSLGSGIAMSLAKNAPADVAFESVVLAETVGAVPTTLGDMSRSFGRELSQWKTYWPENPGWMHPPGNDPKLFGRVATHLAGHLAYPIGLTQGMLLDMVEGAYGRSIDSDTYVHIMSGEKSTISPFADNVLLAEKFDELGVNDVTQDIFLGESHGMIDSVNRLIPALETVIYRD